jgi:four helix bundle protein
MASTRTRFAHQRLDAYRVALELFAGVEALAGSFPRGFADLRDQVRRAAAATVRNIAEGANRIHPNGKAARFAVARGEGGECEAAVEMAGVAELVGASEELRLRALADRVAAILMGPDPPGARKDWRAVTSRRRTAPVDSFRLSQVMAGAVDH